MTDNNSARTYLKSALDEAGVDLKAASLLAGKNHAYFQQYIKVGKPVWLPEAVREYVSKEYNLDSEKLKAPFIKPKIRTALDGGSPQSIIKRKAQFIKDPALLDLLYLWDYASHDTRIAIMMLLRSNIDRISSERIASKTG